MGSLPPHRPRTAALLKIPTEQGQSVHRDRALLPRHADLEKGRWRSECWLVCAAFKYDLMLLHFLLLFCRVIQAACGTILGTPPGTGQALPNSSFIDSLVHMLPWAAYWREDTPGTAATPGPRRRAVSPSSRSCLWRAGPLWEQTPRGDHRRQWHRSPSRAAAASRPHVLLGKGWQPTSGLCAQSATLHRFPVNKYYWVWMDVRAGP